ncbi:MAG TPA: hypothetical protein VFU69_00215 [Ktedonobacterales bacterium]|nr:hypothetical protein [Ktedonobacterales bacterium]
MKFAHSLRTEDLAWRAWRLKIAARGLAATKPAYAGSPDPQARRAFTVVANAAPTRAGSP